MNMITMDQKPTDFFAPAQELDSTTTRLATTLQSAGDGVIVTDMNGRIEFLNVAAERLTGVDSFAAQGRELHEILPLEEKYGAAVRGNLVELAIISETTMNLGKDLLLATHGGSPRQIEGEIAVRTNGVLATGTVVTFRDVTARNSDEVQRREEQKMRAVGQLAGAVSHELNNLLTVVVGHSEALEELYSDLPQVRASTAEIQRAASGIAAVTRQLLTLSRREVLFPTVVNLSQLVEDSTPKLKGLLPAGVELELTLDSQVCTVLVDAAQMEQALVDLVCHARDRMPEGGKIELSTSNTVVDGNCRGRHIRRYVQLKVRDSGPSLRGRSMEELVEPSWNREPGRPSGLGLFTVRNVVSAANGHLSLESEGAAGVSIVLLFPEVEDQVRVPVVKNTAAKRERPATLLLVEDDDGIRILLRNSFEKRGYEVLEARDGEEALLQAELTEGVIDLLITDVVMPNLDGPGLARSLAATRPETKVVLISGCPNELVGVQDLVQRGASFVQKPFSQRELISRIEAVLASA